MRKLAWFAGGFGLACLIFCYFSADLLFSAVSGGVCLLLLTVYWVAKPHKGENPQIFCLPRLRKFFVQLGRRGAVLCLGCTVAFLWAMGYAALFRVPAMELAGTEGIVSGTVTAYPQATSIGGYSVILRLDGDFRSPDVLLYGNEDWGTLMPGDRVSCEARLESAEFLRGDETTYYTARGLFLLGYCDKQPEVEKAESVPIRFWPVLCAETLKTGIYSAFDEVAAPLAAAVTLGDKTGLSEQMHSALNRSGIMHAAVVSGMHISFLSSVLLILCGWRRKAALALVPVLLFYALMAGGTPSAIRAVIMQSVLLAGPLLKRSADTPTSLGFALLVLLVQNPYAAASVSLQLSFVAVTGIILISAKLAEGMLTPVRLRLRGKGRFFRWMLGLYRVVTASIAVSLGAMLLTVPLITLYFDRIPIISPLTNILTLWAVTALMVCALLIGTLAVFLPAPAAIPAMAVGLLAHYIDAIASAVGKFPLAALEGENRYFLIWLMTAYFLAVMIPFAQRRGYFALTSLGSLILLLALAIGLNHATVKRAQLAVTALDVGQGASTLIQSGKYAILVDCGGNSSSSPGDIAADRLAAEGRTSLDALVLTHLDDDHFNGVSQLFWRLDIGQVFLSSTTTEPEHLSQILELAEAEGAKVTFVKETKTFAMGEATLTLFPPLIGGTSNEEGLFALCTCGEFDVLMTGDADSLVEKMLIKYYPIPDLELLMVGHHGSKNSTSARFLNVLRPELAVISVGYNSYGHPAAETLQRLSDVGTQVLRTDLSGTVTVLLRDGKISIR